MEGMVLEIQHFSVHDGPGIRTAVFLKGCQLKCLWCHNPESISSHPELSFIDGLCAGCGNCFKICPNAVHQNISGQHKVNRKKCDLCGLCAERCVGNALKIAGQKMPTAQVIAEVIKDLVYYRESGGGMTLTGGEPMAQRLFVRELAALAKEYHLHVAMETHLAYPYEWLDGIKQHIDLFLVDWKETDSARHREYTGVGNEQIYENIKQLSKEGFKMRIRCPIIPGYNDREQHFRMIAMMTNIFSGIEGAELLPYHRLGIGKIQKFGLEDSLAYISPEEPSAETVDAWVRQCKEYGGRMINPARR